MKSIIALILLFASSILVSAQSTTSICGPGCTATATLDPRSGNSATWPGSVPGSFYAIYDSVVTNIGTCPVDSVGLQFILPSGSSISSSWNLLGESNYYLVTGFEPQLPVNGVINVGIIVYFPSSEGVNTTDAYVIFGATCPDSCVVSSSTASSFTTSNQAYYSTTTSSSSSLPTFTTSAYPSSTSGASAETCTASVTVAQDTTTNPWIDSQGRSNSVYRLTITNTGSQPLLHYALSFSYYPGEIISYWNLQPTLGGYEVVNFGPSLAPGATFTGAGLIVANAPGNIVVADPYGAAC